MSAPASQHEPALSCSDFGYFQDVIREMRNLDDKIVHALNTSIPTRSFEGKVDATAQCKKLFEEMLVSHQQREVAIKHCIAEATGTVDSLRDKRAKDMDNIELLLQLRKQQTKLRMFQAELNVEEVVKERSRKVFNERCRTYYTPPQQS